MTKTIRPATEADLPGVLSLWVALVRDQDRYLKKVRLTKANKEAVTAHHRALARNGQLLVLAEGERVLGFAAVVVDLPTLDFHYASATISDLYVAPEARGGGWGKRLLEAAVALVRDAGLHGVSISVAAGNEAARALYRRAGFRPTDEKLLLPLDADYVKFGPQHEED